MKNEEKLLNSSFSILNSSSGALLSRFSLFITAPLSVAAKRGHSLYTCPVIF